MLDTNVISEFSREEPQKAVIQFIGAQPATDMYIADIVLAELEFGIEMIRDGAKKDSLRSWLDDVRLQYRGRVVATTEASIVRWRCILEDGRKKRQTYSEPDTLLAATAQTHDMIVVTRDWKPFERVGTASLNPWKSQFRSGSGAPPRPVDIANPHLLASLSSP